MIDASLQDGSANVSPSHALLQIAGGPLLARALAIAAQLGIADLIAEAPQGADDLARASNAHGQSLYRLLRMLAANEIFAEDSEGRFHLTPRAHLLRTNVTGSLRDLLRADLQDLFWDAYRALPHTIRTGQTAFTKAFNQEFFDYLADHEDINGSFDAAMAISSGPENEAIARTCKFEDGIRVIDVGGGRGGLLSALLTAYPHLKGTLFDQPQVISAPTYLQEANLLDRCEIEAGDFFVSVPSGGDVYMMKRILHDWDDERALQILSVCRKAAGRHARILTIDAVIEPGNGPDPNKSLDVSIMALVPGKERTRAEFEALYHKAGLKLTRILATPAPSTLSIVEGIVR